MNYLKKQALLARKILVERLTIQQVSDYYREYMKTFTAQDLEKAPFIVKS